MKPNRVLHGVLTIVLMTSLSGCFGIRDQAEPVQQPAELVLPAQCSLTWEPCRQSTPTEYVVEGLTLSPNQGGPGVGILIRALDRDMTLRNVTVRGFDSGVVLSATQCSSCVLRFENVTLIGTSSKGQAQDNPWNEPTGLVAMQTPPHGIPNLRADGLRIQGFQAAVVWMTNERDNRASVEIRGAVMACQHEGLRLGVERVTLEGVEVQGCRGFGVRTASAHLVVARSKLVRNWQGLIAWGSTVDATTRVDDSLFESNEVGGFATGAGAATLTNNAFRNNGVAPNAGAYGGSEADILHAVLTNGDPLVLRGNCLQGNVGWGAVAAVPALMDLAGNWWGSDMGPRQGGPVRGAYERPQPIVPVGAGDLVPIGTPVGSHLTQPPESCRLLAAP